jgi:uncharacterized protein (DUF983 family)
VTQRVPVVRTVWRGARLRCPQCGARTLFARYLKLNPTCPACGADFSNAGTADVAPYLTVLLIGLTCMPLIVSLALTSGEAADRLLAPALVAAAVLTLVLLPRVKGVLAALLWRAGREI